ncbi:extracellular solute-binding protein [Synechocystis sp. LKSZ1]|uniref:extracellular solute-binding protein n=1 Tax=Synechocystis sp. LKSZ1 TaxID=3144951 RepID=UPI00336BEC15
MNFLSRLSRRQFLGGATALSLSQTLGACQGLTTSLGVQFLKNSIPPQLLTRFQREFPDLPPIAFQSLPQLKELAETLSQPSKPQSLVSIGHPWLRDVIRQQQIQPLDPQDWNQWPKLARRWQELGRCDAQGLPSPQGKLWGVPYRWGTTLMVYRREAFEALGWLPQDWSDLWRPELAQRLALVNEPREVIGLTLKKLGHSYNIPQPQAIPQLRPALQALHRQVRFYSSRHYLQALLLKDVWLAVGWSNEILPLLKTEPDLAAVIPRSGTALWADLWVAPTALAPASPLATWLNFLWEPTSANQISLFGGGASPRLETLAPDQIMPAVAQNALLNVPTALLDRCEVIQPLPYSSEQQYRQLWQGLETPPAT